MNASLICHTVPETEKIMEKEDTLKQKSYNVHIVHQVADGALRCFASLADRFIRREVDPAPLALHGLTQELLQRLASAGCSAVASTAASSPGTALHHTTPI